MAPALATPLAHASLSGAAADAVRKMILDGRLRPGERLNEVHLAAALGVSRTPLREGLRFLTAEGALDNEPHRGFFVRPLTLEELDQLYDIRPLLDPEALRLAGIPDAARIAQLGKLNRALGAARGPAAVELDDEWHLLLVAACPNKVLIELIEQIIRRTRRYEIALLRATRNVRRASEDHVRILGALKVGDLEAACAALQHNMQSGKAPLVAWLKQRTV